MVSPALEAVCAAPRVLNGSCERPEPPPGALFLTYQTRPLRLMVTVRVTVSIPSVTWYWKLSEAAVSPAFGVKVNSPLVARSTLPPLVVVPPTIATADSGFGPSGSVKFATRLPATKTDTGRACAALNSNCVLPTVSKVSFGLATGVGGMLGTLSVKVCIAAGDTPLLAVMVITYGEPVCDP